MLWAICKALKRSPTICALHVSGNPGINEEIKAQLRRKLVTRPYRSDRHVDLNAGIEKDDNPVELSGAKEEQLKESMAVRQMNRVPILDGKMTEKSLENTNKLIFER
jgi:hypothetical protein